MTAPARPLSPWGDCPACGLGAYHLLGHVGAATVPDPRFPAAFDLLWTHPETSLVRHVERECVACGAHWTEGAAV